MSYTVIVPARYASARLPGKPLLDLNGKPMIQRVWERARAAGARRVLIATDDERIRRVARDFGAEVAMTRADHPSGTDRLGEAIERLQLSDEEIVVNVQGDEPLIPPAVLDQVAANLQGAPDASLATLCERIADPATLRDPNAVKVVFDRRGFALYFSRAAIPWPRDHDWDGGLMPAGEWYRHLGIYAYRAGFLRRYRRWPVAALERIECLEQLRAQSHGERIHVALACASVPRGVDTPDDLHALRERWAAR